MCAEFYACTLLNIYFVLSCPRDLSIWLRRVSYLQTLFRERNQLKLLAHLQVWEGAAGRAGGCIVTEHQWLSP